MPSKFFFVFFFFFHFIFGLLSFPSLHHQQSKRGRKKSPKGTLINIASGLDGIQTDLEVFFFFKQKYLLLCWFCFWCDKKKSNKHGNKSWIGVYIWKIRIEVVPMVEELYSASTYNCCSIHVLAYLLALTDEFQKKICYTKNGKHMNAYAPETITISWFALENHTVHRFGRAKGRTINVCGARCVFYRMCTWHILSTPILTCFPFVRMPTFFFFFVYFHNMYNKQGRTCFLVFHPLLNCNGFSCRTSKYSNNTHYALDVCRIATAHVSLYVLLVCFISQNSTNFPTLATWRGIHLCAVRSGVEQ